MPSSRSYLAIAVETLLLLLNTAQLLLILSFFWGGQASDNVYTYANVVQAAIGATLFCGLGGYWLVQDATLAQFCHLIPISLHIVAHLVAFTFAHYALVPDHTIGSLLAALGFMMGMSFTSINVMITYLHNA